VQPALKDVLDSLNKVPLLPANFGGRSTLAKWLEELNARRAAESLDDGEQTRTLLPRCALSIFISA
jgi:hypothetical protein